MRALFDWYGWDSYFRNIVLRHFRLESRNIQIWGQRGNSSRALERDILVLSWEKAWKSQNFSVVNRDWRWERIGCFVVVADQHCMRYVMDNNDMRSPWIAWGGEVRSGSPVCKAAALRWRTGSGAVCSEALKRPFSFPIPTHLTRETSDKDNADQVQITYRANFAWNSVRYAIQIQLLKYDEKSTQCLVFPFKWWTLANYEEETEIWSKR